MRGSTREIVSAMVSSQDTSHREDVRSADLGLSGVMLLDDHPQKYFLKVNAGMGRFRFTKPAEALAEEMAECGPEEFPGAHDSNAG